MSRSFLLALALLATGVCVSPDVVDAQPADDALVTVSPFVFPEGVDPDAAIGALRYRGAVVIESVDEIGNPFYGLSGFWVSPDGRQYFGTEGGNWFNGSLTYAQDGYLNGFDILQTGPLLDSNGDPFAEEADKDAEALDFDGTHFLVGFEANNRVLRYRDFQSPAELLPLPAEALEGITAGGGFSSIAHSAGVGIIAMPEMRWPDRTRGWLVTDDGEGEIRLRPPGDWWLPVSISSFPNGDLLVLEIYQGPETETITVTRLGRISAESVQIGQIMEPVEIATLEPPLTEARFEGSAIRVGPDGQTYIYVIYNASPSVLFMFEVIT